MCAAIMDPHDKMRARDVSKVSRGEQAPRPPHQSPKVKLHLHYSISFFQIRGPIHQIRCGVVMIITMSITSASKKREKRHKNARKLPSITRKHVPTGLGIGALSEEVQLHWKSLGLA
ncbi:hypothetical protein ACJIZ3_025346 [Penstemon smallii]|uniref:Uncharacterized protein n=1 Tax=Penstemon smallii TaxID=265156 RepID=A0ABD3TUP7_9LAMI